MTIQPFVSVLLTTVLGWPAFAAPVPDALRILVLEGDRAVNNIRSRAATAPVVEVRDANGRPVEGAAVTFGLPQSGAGGVFADQALEQTVRTNQQGQATPAGFAPNGQTGRFTIRVSAASAGRTAETAIIQFNSENTFAPQPPQRSGGKKKWILLGILAAAGAGVAVGVTSRDSEPVRVILVPGGAAVAGPR